MGPWGLGLVEEPERSEKPHKEQKVSLVVPTAPWKALSPAVWLLPFPLQHVLIGCCYHIFLGSGALAFSY